MEKLNKKMVLFTLPILLSLFIQALYGAVDLWAVGSFGTSNDISAVAIGSEFMQIVTQLIVGLTMGVTVLLATNRGSGDIENSRYIIGTSFRVFFVFGFVISVITTVFSSFFAHLMNTPSEAFKETTIYIRVCGISSIAIVFFNLLSQIFRALGDSRTPFVFVCITSILNVIGDYVLTKYFFLGTLGVAIATALSQFISCIFMFIFIKVKGFGFEFTYKDIFVHKKFALSMLRLGTPIALQSSITEASYAVVISFANTMGVLVSAGVGVASKVIMFVYLVPTAFLQSVSVFTSESLGANNRKRAKDVLILSSLQAVFVGGICAFVLFFFGDSVSSIFTDDIKIIEISWEYLKVCSVECLVLSYVYCLLGFLNGSKQTRFVMIEGLLAIFIVKIPYAFYATFITTPRVYNIALSDTLASIFQLIVCLIYFLCVKHIRALKEDHHTLE